MKKLPNTKITWLVVSVLLAMSCTACILPGIFDSEDPLPEKIELRERHLGWGDGALVSDTKLAEFSSFWE